jgi:hypothetical protein
MNEERMTTTPYATTIKTGAALLWRDRLVGLWRKVHLIQKVLLAAQ